MTDELAFHTNPQSRGRIVRWMLEELGVPYRTEIVAYGPAMKSPDFLAINPMGKVPVIRHGSTIVTEAAAICAYLADAFPEAGLSPPPGRRGAYYRWLFFAAGPLEAAVVNRSLGFETPADKESMAGYGNFAQVMDTLEKAVEHALQRGGWIADDGFTAADLYVGAHIGWGLHFGTIEQRPAFERYWTRASDRDAYRRANAFDDEAATS